MNQQMKIVKEIAVRADNDDFYNKAKEFGRIAADAFRHKAQMKNLENIANSTLKVSDVLDYIKKQVARCKLNEMWNHNDFGKQLKDHIEKNIRSNRNVICKTLTIPEDSPEAQRIYLDLIREFVRQLVVHFEYTIR